VIPREDKYKAKSFLDTVVYRAGDQIGSWSYALMGAIGVALTGIALVAVPLSALWVGLAYWLGRRQELAVAAAHATEKPVLPVPAAESLSRLGQSDRTGQGERSGANP